MSPSRVLPAPGTSPYHLVPKHLRATWPRPDQSHLLPEACSPNGTDNRQQRQRRTKRPPPEPSDILKRFYALYDDKLRYYMKKVFKLNCGLNPFLPTVPQVEHSILAKIAKKFGQKWVNLFGWWVLPQLWISFHDFNIITIFTSFYYFFFTNLLLVELVLSVSASNRVRLRIKSSSDSGSIREGDTVTVSCDISGGKSPFDVVHIVRQIKGQEYQITTNDFLKDTYKNTGRYRIGRWEEDGTIELVINSRFFCDNSCLCYVFKLITARRGPIHTYMCQTGGIGSGATRLICSGDT